MNLKLNFHLNEKVMVTKDVSTFSFSQSHELPLFA
jgi:hypothetical protein